MLENGIRLLVLIYLGVMAIIDVKTKKIPIVPGALCLFGVSTGQMVNGTSWQNWLPGVIIGCILYMISKLSRGAIGEGDAFIYVLTGATVGIAKNVEILLISLFLCSLFSLALFVLGRVKKKDQIAFVPFIFVAYGMVIIG